MTHAKDIPIPERMKNLRFDDRRGIPIPYVVLIDKTGAPQYKINDEEKNVQCFEKKLCHICGQKLNGEFWFIGGQLSAFHPRGAFVDGAVHKECGLYALQVCPYMVFSNYKAISDTEKFA